MGCPHSVDINDENSLAKRVGMALTFRKNTRKTCCSISSAVIIQQWYRRYRARLEARRRCAWLIYQSLEYDKEQNHLKLYALYKEFIETVQRQDSLNDVEMTPENRTMSKKCWNGDWLPPVPADYKGPRIRFPLDLQQLVNLLELFTAKKRIHCYYIYTLLTHALQILSARPNVQRAYTSISRQITVIGDLHGQFADLNMIFSKNGIPDVTNPYVFNGDIVDRGQNSVETLVVILYILVWRPTAVFLNRGNHEDRYVNFHYGFIKEIQCKYKSEAGPLVSCFSDLYRFFPLATLIDDKVFVCHGGISETTDLETLERLCRTDFYTLMESGKKDTRDANEKVQYQALLWSDPCSASGSKVNKKRGMGCCFGPDVTKQVLERNNWTLLVRSHECKDDGYEWNHDGKVLTIFSASNYYAEGSNKGAYLKIEADGNVKPIQFIVAGGDITKTLTQLVNVTEACALTDLRRKITMHSTELTEQFLKADPQKTGKISINKWAEIMEQVLGLKLPWHTLQPRLTKTAKSGGMVHYQTTFKPISVSNKIGKISSTITEELYKGRDILEAIFRAIDKDNSGLITLEEFKMACSRLPNRTNLDEENIEDLAKLIDLNKDGYIDFNEFLEAFRLAGEKCDVMEYNEE